jgi:Acyl-CoA synthetases (AMP-forming)/AMP-acid ligases II
VADITTGQTTASLWAAACRDFGERRFLVHLDATGGRAEYSYARFATLIHQAAHAFLEVGVRSGDPVVLQVRNRPEMLAAFFGLTEIGAIVVPLGMDATPAELLRAYQACGAEWAVVEPHLWPTHQRLRAEAGLSAVGVLVVGDQDGKPQAHGAGAWDFRELCAQQSSEPVVAPELDGRRVAELLYTSGTTAAPKGVMITHANLVFSGHYGVWQTSLRADDRVFTTMPACHSNFQLAALTPVLVAGATLVMAEHYSASQFWSQVRGERASVVQLIAMMVRTLLLQPPAAEDTDHQLREALYFMPLSDAEKQSFETRFGLRLMNSYGSTESIGWAVTDPPVGERRWPSVGRAGLGYEVGIFDHCGNELPPGEIGEFRIKGTPGVSLMLGYHDDPAATASALSEDGWLRTHDEGYRDEDGWFYFVDRAVNLIKRAGENISASEVECVLTSHPLIAEAAVIGVPDPIRDKAVLAYVRLQPGARLSVAEILQHCRGQLAGFKVPSYVEFVDDFPRTASMKIEKCRLQRAEPQCRGTDEGNH